MRDNGRKIWPLAGVVFILISVPFILRKVPPNSWSGFRVAKTLSDEKIWYDANQTMGYDLLIVGVITLVCSLTTAIYLGQNRSLANRINIVVFLGTLALATLHSFWALSRM